MPSAQHWAGGDLFVQPDWAAIRCRECDLVYRSHALPLSELARYYDALEYESFETAQTYPTDRIVVSEILRRMSSGRVLDYGCGVGRILQQLGSRFERWGIEVNRRSAEIAVSRGIKIITEEDLDVAGRVGFECVLVTDVYEHLTEPVQLMRRLLGVMKPGALLLVVTGCADFCPRGLAIHEGWYFSPIGHLQMVTLRHLSWLAQRLGLVLENATRACHYDVRLGQRVWEWGRLWLYLASRPGRFYRTSKLMRSLPLFGKASGWVNPPAVCCARDHVVAVFRKSAATLDQEWG